MFHLPQNNRNKWANWTHQQIFNQIIFQRISFARFHTFITRFNLFFFNWNWMILFFFIVCFHNECSSTLHSSSSKQSSSVPYWTRHSTVKLNVNTNWLSLSYSSYKHTRVSAMTNCVTQSVFYVCDALRQFWVFTFQCCDVA